MAEQNETELSKHKTRKEEEKFFEKFSGTQINTVMVLILSSTFLVQGIIKYLSEIGRTHILNTWFLYIIAGIGFLSLSVFLISVDRVVAPLKIKRKLNASSYVVFLLGFVLFLVSLTYLMANLL